MVCKKTKRPIVDSEQGVCDPLSDQPIYTDGVATSVKGALETKLATSKFSTQIDAIALGVEAKLDPLSNYLKLVTERTVDIARQLAIAEEEIQRWIAMRSMHDSKRNRIIESSLRRLK